MIDLKINVLQQLINGYCGVMWLFKVHNYFVTLAKLDTDEH